MLKSEGKPVRRRSIGIRLLLLLVSLTSIVVLTILVVALEREIGWLDRDRPFTCTLRGAAEESANKNSDKLQLVGYVTFTRRFSVFKRSRADEVMVSLTVLCKGGRYHTAPGLPHSYLMSLLDQREYPLLAKPPVAIEEIPGATDAEAIRNALEAAKREFGHE